jgi:hypothetical protein
MSEDICFRGCPYGASMKKPKMPKRERKRLKREEDDLRDAGTRVAEERMVQKERIVAAAVARELARQGDPANFHRAEAVLIEAVLGLK